MNIDPITGLSHDRIRDIQSGENLVPLSDVGDSMTFADFHNGLRLLNSIDLHELKDQGIFTEPGATSAKNWTSFRDDPWRYFIRASDREGAAIWQAMQKRMRP